MIFFRTDPAQAWQQYVAPFNLTSDTAVEYYGVNYSGLHARLFTANYSIGTATNASFTLNLTNGVAVTNNSSTVGGNTNVLLSTGGTIFYGRKNSSGGAIWAINLDGSDDTYITTGVRPRVSPDGRYLAFMRGTNVFNGIGGDVWLRDLSTGLETEFFTNNAEITGYDWDTATPPNLILDYGCNFWIAPLTNPASMFPLTNHCNFFAPVVNPVNGTLAFFDTDTSGGLRTVPAGGGDSTILGPTVSGARWPAWSPDGARLSFCYPGYYSAFDLFTINADGSALAQISAFTNASDGFAYGAIWSPTGNALVGAGSIYGTNGLWKIPLTSDSQHCDCPAKLLPTTPGDPIDFAGSVITQPAPVIAKPGLFIRTDPNAIVVYWSTNYQGFALQSTLALGASNDWTSLSGPYFQNGNYYEYHEALTALAAAKFFRLQFAGVIIVQPLQPRLSVSTDSGQFVLNWSTNYAGYTLEATTNLNPPAIWSPASVVGSNPNGRCEYRENFNQPLKFFRLHWQ